MIFILISRQFIMSIVKGKFELELMRGYEEQFRQRMSKVVTLAYECLPLNLEEYNQKVLESLDSMKPIDPNVKDLAQFDQLILGRIEGQLAAANFKQIVESVVGEVSEEKLKAYLKQKTEQRNFGASNKDKNCFIRQVKKLQSLQKYFDVNEISKKRKFNKLYSASIKSLAKYLDLYAKIDETNSETIEKAFDQYGNYVKEQKKFAQFMKDMEQSKNIIEKPSAIDEIKEQKQEGAIEQEHKICEAQEINQNTQEKNKQEKEEKKQEHKENKTPKKTKSKKKESKTEAVMPEPNSAQMALKDKCESEDKKEQKEGKQNKDKEKEKTVKKPTNKLLTEFFVVKKKDTNEAKKVSTEASNNINGAPSQLRQGESQQLVKKDDEAKNQSIWDSFGDERRQLQSNQRNVIEMSVLRRELRGYRMENEQYNPEPYYTNIVITLSTIEYYDYLMQIDRSVDFAEPFKKIAEVLYFEDESQQFEGESADAQADQEEQDQDEQLSEGNHTILSDDHLSNEELSSCQVDQIQLKVQYGKGRKWVTNFFAKTNSMQSEEELDILNNFSMICLENSSDLPLRLDQEEETVQFTMTAQMWRDVYKLAHGYHGTKQSIIKDLSVILPGVSKTWIDTMLRERSQKLINQRFIKKDFIDDLKEKIPDIDSLLQKVLEERNEQLRKIKAEKNQEKDLKLEKDILECTGSRYIVNLIKQLKQKGYKQMRRNQLIQFINERKGQEWDKIRAEMNTMSKPIAQMIKNMPATQKIDEEVEVDDEEYRKMENPEKKQGQQRLDAFLSKNKKQNLEDKANWDCEAKINNKKQKKSDKMQQHKNKIKRRKKKQSDSHSFLYEKTKPINRGRKTKNSLKTGIPSIEELRKMKQEEKLKLREEQEIENHEDQQRESESAEEIDEKQNALEGQKNFQENQGLEHMKEVIQQVLSSEEQKLQQVQMTGQKRVSDEKCQAMSVCESRDTTPVKESESEQKIQQSTIKNVGTQINIRQEQNNPTAESQLC